MNKLTEFATTDHELAKLTKGLTLFQSATGNQYWNGEKLEYVIVFDNEATTYKAFRVTPIPPPNAAEIARNGLK